MPTFYDLELRRMTFRELTTSAPWHLLPFFALLKLSNYPLRGTTGNPPVDRLTPFEVEAAALPEEVRACLHPLTGEREALGFHDPVYHAVDCPRQATRYRWANFTHATGTAWARIHHQVWTGAGNPRTFLFTRIVTELDDGTFLVSTTGLPDPRPAEGVRVVNCVGASGAGLWERHKRELAELLPLQPRVVADRDALRASLERLHARDVEDNLQRGIFQLPGEEAHRPPAEPRDGPAVSPEDATVLFEVERLGKTGASSWGMLLILVVSLLLFLAASPFRVGWSWQFVATLIGVLLFHELGHYLAMRWFGYRNLRMFFIPFLGAAVSGRHYNVAGWKKAVVALMGPVPGILAGTAVGLAGVYYDQPQVTTVAVLLLVLNGFNLLPLLPLDGGWVVHAVLFVRHPLLDLAFRLLAIAGVAALAVLSGDWILFLIPALMLIALPVSWRIATAAHRLRRQGFAAVSPDADSIPAASALPILAELRTGQRGPASPGVLARQVVSVFETLNARPPGLLASLGLLTVHAGSFLASVVVVGLLVLAQFEVLQGMTGPGPEPGPPAHAYAPGLTESWRGANAPAQPPGPRATVIATFAGQQAARDVFGALRSEMPADATLRWFGESVLVTLPAEREAEQTSWAERLRERGAVVAVEQPDRKVLLWLTCKAPGAQEAERIESELRQYLHSTVNDLLLPPWSARWESLPPVERDRFRTARRTLDRLDNLYLEATRHPDVRAMQRRLPWVMLTRGRKAHAQRVLSIGEVTRAEEQRLLEAMRAEGEGSVDGTVLELWERSKKLGAEGVPLTAPEAGQPSDPQQMMRDLLALSVRLAAVGREREALQRQMAERMGPAQAGALGIDPGAARGGVQRDGVVLSINYLSFGHPSEGLPALAEWLGRAGCTDFRYEFQPPARPEEDPGAE
jgi:Zn-dependent protease